MGEPWYMWLDASTGTRPMWLLAAVGEEISVLPSRFDSSVSVDTQNH